MLVLRNATFRLNDRLVFPETTWSWNRGEQWALTGGNGSGKSLFLEALRGRLPLVEGDLEYQFRPPLGLSQEEALAHLTFEEDPGLHGAVLQARWNSIEEEGALSVAELLAYDRIMEVSAYEVTDRHEAARRVFQKRLAKAIRILEIPHLLSRRAMSLSSGERKKVRLAGALARPSRLLLLDEPFSGLDVTSRRHFSEALQRLAQHGLHLIVATTRPQDLPRAFKHVLEMKDLRVAGAGIRRQSQTRLPSPDVAKKRPMTRAVSGSVLVRLNKIRVQYGETLIFEGLNWTVRAGERWALLGPNGSGKSTLIGLLTGDHPQASANDIMLFGQRPGQGCSVWSLKRQLGTVSPELHLYFAPEAPVLHVVASGFFESAGLFETPSAAQVRQAARWLGRLQLSALANESFGALSLGQQRLVLLARAMVKEPLLLLLDEPCQGLDEGHRELILNLIDSPALQKSALVYVSHREDELPRSISHVFRLPVSIERSSRAF